MLLVLGFNLIGVVIGILLVLFSVGFKFVGLVNFGVVLVGLVSVGLVSVGLVFMLGVGVRVVLGVVSDLGRVGVRFGLVRVGLVRFGLVNFGLVNFGLVRLGLVRFVLVLLFLVRLGIGGMLILNWDNFCDSVDISLLGRLVNIVVCLNLWCLGCLVVLVDL